MQCLYEVGGPHQTTILSTVLLAAFAATAAVVCCEVVDKGKQNLMHNCSVFTSVGDRGLRRNVLTGFRVHSALEHPELPVPIDPTTKFA